jgi:hypothetical protein
MSDEASVATQSVGEGHDTPSNDPVVSTSDNDHADAPPVGSVEESTVPPLSTATQNEVLGHEVPRIAYP